MAKQEKQIVMDIKKNEDSSDDHKPIETKKN